MTKYSLDVIYYVIISFFNMEWLTSLIETFRLNIDLNIT